MTWLQGILLCTYIDYHSVFPLCARIFCFLESLGYYGLNDSWLRTTSGVRRPQVLPQSHYQPVSWALTTLMPILTLSNITWSRKSSWYQDLDYFDRSIHIHPWTLVIWWFGHTVGITCPNGNGASETKIAIQMRILISRCTILLTTFIDLPGGKNLHVEFLLSS